MSKLIAKKPKQITREYKYSKHEQAVIDTIPEYKPNESQIAIAFVDYVAKVHPDLSEDLIKIDNENKCSWVEGKKKKAMGKRKGASDYFYARAAYQRLGKDGHSQWPLYFGLWLEIKSEKGKESPEQKAFGIRQINNGYAYRVVYTVDEAIREFEDYIK